MLSLDDAYAAFPEAREDIDVLVAHAKEMGCDCSEPFFKTKDEMMAEYDELTPQQRVQVLGEMYPGVLFLEHETRCNNRRISMSPYN